MGIKNTIIAIKYFPSDIFNRLVMTLRGIKYGQGLKTFGCMFIRGRGQVSIGDNVRITSCRETNPIGGDTKMVIHAKAGSRISIGNNVGISNSAIIAMDSVTIEDNVLVGGSCKIYDNDFHSTSYEVRMKDVNGGIKAKPVLIKEGAFIGAHSIILKGVTIGRHSVIGAGSVVTKDVPDGEIWAGNPAKFIKKLEE